MQQLSPSDLNLKHNVVVKAGVFDRPMEAGLLFLGTHTTCLTFPLVTQAGHLSSNGLHFTMAEWERALSWNLQVYFWVEEMHSLALRREGVPIGGDETGASQQSTGQDRGERGRALQQHVCATLVKVSSGCKACERASQASDPEMQARDL